MPAAISHPTSSYTSPQTEFPCTDIVCYSPPRPKNLLVDSYISPTLEALRTTLEPEDEEDMDVLPPEEATLEMTDRAAEQLRAIAEREKNPDAALRIAVESGGCHGYQYKMELAKKRNPDD
ncbi:hypothetical protein PHLCEN_2v7644 [Hermanssonia centrifuga]|uniref:Core domain-containing protein n=1 Tax=Hermanssonia centrifuga TaxID=98765 RepID=A0A2R6NW50_9APHY|nr:hypothetical protein PHLCEN_2v7644 [Hermanssonia centrifuga]